jgi:catechol 2,3-dioxygenase-like lactoylglutathione lyase family enzyme
MRLDDLCLVNTDVTASDDFYREQVGLPRRMRNERFVDFLLGDGPRLAMWMRPSITETVGAAYPTEPGAPFRITLDLGEGDGTHPVTEDAGSGGAGPRYLEDPDGFVLAIHPRDPAPSGWATPRGPRIVTVDLAVTDVVASREFLSTLGFRALASMPGAAGGSVAFDAGSVVLTLVDAALVTPDDPTWSRSGGHLMLAIELDTGEAVDAAHAELRSRGLVDSGDPAVYEWGARSTYFVDPDAFIWEIYAWVEEPR